MSKKKPALLYLITNALNGATYVGITTRIDVMKRFNEHFYAARQKTDEGKLHRAMRKYPKEAFSVCVIAYYFDVEDAKAAEIQYIAENKPEYNSTLGGDGRLGGTMSKAAREKIKKLHTGNKYRLGKTHTEEVKRTLAELGHKNIERFQKFQHLGPLSIKKRVRCIETGEEWSSIKEASAAKKIARSSIAEVCLKRPWRKTAGGLRFEFVESKDAPAR
jgi:group I intron endonuclease